MNQQRATFALRMLAGAVSDIHATAAMVLWHAFHPSLRCPLPPCSGGLSIASHGTLPFSLRRCVLYRSNFQKSTVLLCVPSTVRCPAWKRKPRNRSLIPIAGHSRSSADKRERSKLAAMDDAVCGWRTDRSDIPDRDGAQAGLYCTAS